MGEKVIQELELAFDVGHSSVGWAVFNTDKQIEIKGCGSVIFRADDCLASSRRTYRRQRRHIRSTRQRIARMKTVLKHLGALTENELNQPGCAWPWLLAARVLRGGKLLTWPELWDVLRWYAHNRGYDGNRRWSAAEAEAQKEDSEKEANAHTLMGKYGTDSMAETFCGVSGIDPLGKRKSTNLPSDKRPKGQNAAFPRGVVEREVRGILQKHTSKLKGVDTNLEKVLFSDWRAIPCPDLKLPERYEGGLLFGQLVPRFDNRIISVCPKSGQKVPSRNCPEFLNFRWGMQLANIKVGRVKDRELQPLAAEHRVALDKQMRERGYLTPTELKNTVRNITNCERDNLDTMLMHPDAKEALVLDPVQKLILSDDIQPFWELLPERLQKRLRGQWRRGKIFSLEQIRKQLELLGGDVGAFDAELQRQLDAQNSKAKKKGRQFTFDGLLKKQFPSKLLKLDGRAAFARHLLKQAYEDVLAGKPHPKEEGGCLFITQEMRDTQLNRAIAKQTNNHLVRHRLLILERLLKHIIMEYAAGEKERVGKITIEVNRDLREMSGKDSKAKEREMREKLGNIRAVEKYVLDRLPEKYHGRINGSFLRKARVADDLDWHCPYTGELIQPIHLATGIMDVDHIIPYAIRPSNSLDSLVVTFAIINKMKGKRTAAQFMKDMSGQPVCFVNERGRTERVEGMPNLSLMQFRDFRAFTDKLKIRGKGEHEQDKERRLRRKRLLEIASYEQKEFLQRDLTQTSQLVRLGAQVLRKNLPHLTTGDVISLPGSVTGAVRKAWKVLGCLAAANSHVLDENGEVKNKTEIRDITHLHHALDACVLGLASHFIPNNGRIWELIVKRNLNELEQRQLMALDIFGFNAEKRFEMHDLDKKLKEQIRQRLAEKRVVQHIPARMDGLRVEQNTWRVISVKDGEATIQQRIRQPDGSRPQKPPVKEKVTKLLGLEPVNGKGKLAANKGALVIPDNYGVALEPQPTIIPFHKVWTRLQEIKKTNGGKIPRILRNGQIIRVPEGKYKGVWRVFSAKNNATGMAIDMGQPDVVRLKNKTEGHKINVLLSSLLKNKMTVVKTPLTGTAA